MARFKQDQAAQQALAQTVRLADVKGAPIVKGKRVTGFANSEEEGIRALRRSHYRGDFCGLFDRATFDFDL